VATEVSINVSGKWRAIFTSSTGVETGRYIYGLDQKGDDITGSAYPEANPSYVLSVSGKLTGTHIRLSWTHQLTAEELAQAAGDPALSGAKEAAFVVDATVGGTKMTGGCVTIIGKTAIAKGGAAFAKL